VSAIDIHQHLWPEPLLAALARRTRPPRLLRHDGGWTLQMHGEPDAPFDVADHDPDRRVALLDALDIERAMVAPSTPIGIEALPPDEAAELIEVVRGAGLHGAVGHVERCNPALLELRRRVQAGQLGEIFLVATERVGPFPDRIRDVGVVKDLATHDLDLVRWLGGAPIERVAAQTQHRMGREHEDLVLVTGRLENGRAFNSQVDWLSPTKVRRTRVLGERGMLVADTLTADLTFYANGAMNTEWEALRAFRGVAEGDMIRYAIPKREPLLVEHERFRDAVEGKESDIVTVRQGMRTVEVAAAVLRSARAGTTVQVPASAG
jgi:predicted dehydrogenase